jgi:MFS family permease
MKSLIIRFFFAIIASSLVALSLCLSVFISYWYLILFLISGIILVAFDYIVELTIDHYSERKVIVNSYKIFFEYFGIISLAGSVLGILYLTNNGYRDHEILFGLTILSILLLFIQLRYLLILYRYSIKIKKRELKSHKNRY